MIIFFPGHSPLPLLSVFQEDGIRYPRFELTDRGKGTCLSFNQGVFPSNSTLIRLQRIYMSLIVDML